MSEDWDSVTRIGSRRGGGGAPRAKVIKGTSALNAAFRQGGVTTERKTGKNPEAQRLANVANDPDIRAAPKTGDDVCDAIRAQMVRLGLRDRDLASLIAMKEPDFKNALSSKSTLKLSGKQLNQLQQKLGVKLTGSGIGELTALGKKLVKARANQAKEAEAAKPSEVVEDANVDEVEDVEVEKDAEVVKGEETAEDTAAAREAAKVET